MTENGGSASKLRRLSAWEQYELEHLAKKYDVHARLAKAGRAVERETRDDVDESIGPVRKTGA
jgi:hypothetical protein